MAVVPYSIQSDFSPRHLRRSVRIVYGALKGFILLIDLRLYGQIPNSNSCKASSLFCFFTLDTCAWFYNFRSGFIRVISPNLPHNHGDDCSKTGKRSESGSTSPDNGCHWGNMELRRGNCLEMEAGHNSCVESSSRIIGSRQRAQYE